VSTFPTPIPIPAAKTPAHWRVIGPLGSPLDFTVNPDGSLTALDDWYAPITAGGLLLGIREEPSPSRFYRGI
jgi:hypothetical protein